MAEEEEPLLANPGSQEMTVHVHDYDRFTRMMKWGALACLVIGLIVLLILK
jgi:Bacterial aa3 type cytochrome c oxidase subunit IV